MDLMTPADLRKRTEVIAQELIEKQKLQAEAEERKRQEHIQTVFEIYSQSLPEILMEASNCGFFKTSVFQYDRSDEKSVFENRDVSERLKKLLETDGYTCAYRSFKND